MSKRYKLLKPLPDSVPGDIYIWNNSQRAYYKNGNVLDSYWQAAEVELMPDWFELIPEPQPQESFTWEEIVSVIKSQCDGTYSEDRYNWNFVGDDAPAKLLIALKQSKSSPQPKEDKPEWEIVAYGTSKNDLLYNHGIFDKNYKPIEGLPIFSVQRNSDGEIFSVGDEVEVVKEDEPKGWVGKIDSFWLTHKIEGRPQKMHICYNGHHYNIKYFRKYQPKEEVKEPEQPKEERIEVTVNGPEFHGAIIEFRANRANLIKKEKFPAIKQAIENVLNDETPIQ
jgi:hypothetical protein